MISEVNPMIRFGLLAVLIAALSFVSGSIRAEVIEEIVAWVNGEIITRSEYDEEEQAMMSEAYRRYTGEELDARVASVKAELLQRMIDRKILIDHGKSLGFDMSDMAQDLYLDFRESQKESMSIESDEEFERLLARDGMTVDDVKSKLIEMYAPEQVLRFEISKRLAVSDEDIEAYYAENPGEFLVVGEVTLKEIVLLAASEEDRSERRDEIDAIRARLEAGEDFAAVAQEVSEAGTRESGGDLGTLKQSDISEVLEPPAFGLPVGTVSDVLETSYGFHIIRVESRSDEHMTPLDEIKDRLRQFLSDRKYATEVEGFLEKARAKAQWCVRPAYAEQLAVKPPPCESL